MPLEATEVASESLLLFTTSTVANVPPRTGKYVKAPVTDYSDSSLKNPLGGEKLKNLFVKRIFQESFEQLAVDAEKFLS